MKGKAGGSKCDVQTTQAEAADLEAPKQESAESKKEVCEAPKKESAESKKEVCEAPKKESAESKKEVLETPGEEEEESPEPQNEGVAEDIEASLSSVKDKAEDQQEGKTPAEEEEQQQEEMDQGETQVLQREDEESQNSKTCQAPRWTVSCSCSQHSEIYIDACRCQVVLLECRLPRHVQVVPVSLRICTRVCLCLFLLPRPCSASTRRSEPRSKDSFVDEDRMTQRLAIGVIEALEICNKSDKFKDKEVQIQPLVKLCFV